MSRSSTSSSDAAAAPIRTRQFSLRHLWKFPACVVGLLIVAELILRTPIVMSLLPIRTHYHEAGIVRRVEALERVLAERGSIDILFVGSSIVRCNIQPLDFDRAVMSPAGAHRFTLMLASELGSRLPGTVTARRR